MKVRNILFIIIFFIPVALPLIFFAPEKTVSESENRMLTALDFSATSGVGDKIDVAEGWFCDHLGFRDEMFRYLMGAKYHMFGVINYLDMIEGTAPGQWYTMDSYQEMDYTGVDPFFPDISLGQFTEGISAANDWMAERDIPFVVMINPDKMEVEDQYLPKRYIKNDIGFRADRIARSLRNAGDIPVVLSKEAMIAAEEDGSVPETFWPSYDVTHWNYEGAFIAYESLMDVLCEIKSVPVLSYEDADFDTDTFDKSFIWGIDWQDETPAWHINNKSSKVDSDLPPELSDIGTYYHFHNFDLEDEGTSIVIAGDSYIQEYLIDLLRQSYTDIYFVLCYDDGDALFRVAEAVEPDIVLFEWASRMFPRLGGGIMKGWGV